MKYLLQVTREELSEEPTIYLFRYTFVQEIQTKNKYATTLLNTNSFL